MVFARYLIEKNLYTDYTAGGETAPNGFEAIPASLEDKFFQCFPLAQPVTKSGVVVDIIKGVAPPQPAPDIDPITQIQIAIAELAEAGAQNNMNNKLAIAELAEIVAGGKTNG